MKVLELSLDGNTFDSVTGAQGTMVGDASWVMLPTGKQVINLNGNGHISIPSNASLNSFMTTGEISLAVWLRPSMPAADMLTTNYPILHKMANVAGGKGGSFQLLMKPEVIGGITQPNFYANLSQQDTGYDTIRNLAVPQAGMWYCVIFTFSPINGVKRVYINGVLDRELTYTAPPVWIENGEPLCIGDEPSVAPWWYNIGFIGQIGQVSIYNHALGSLEATTFYNMAVQDYPSQFDDVPVAQFTAIPVTGNAPLAVVFNDESTSVDPILSWEWEFGDGSTSTSQNPTHVFANAGQFVVTLIVTNRSGESLPYSVNVDVSAKPTNILPWLVAAGTIGAIAVGLIKKK